jgi:hypothetical protein
VNWIEINDASQLKVDDILRFVIDINGKPEDGNIYKILKISKNFIVITKVNHFEPWILPLNVIEEFSFFKSDSGF